MRAFGFKGLRQSKWFSRRSYKVAQYSLVTGAVLLGFSGCRAQEAPLTHLTPPSQPIPASYFGLHIHRAAADTWPSIPFGEWRFWDAEGTAWYNLEPQPGKWDWTRLDRDVSLAEQHHVGIILTLGQSPPWASSRPNDPPAWRPGGPAPPRNEEDWKNYVRTVATRYKGRIHVYEVWNEPNLKMFYSGTREQLVQLAKDAYEVLHEVDPTVLVVSPSVTGWADVPWFGKYLDLGGGKYADVIGYHFYSSPHTPEFAVDVIQRVEAAMKAHGVNKPLWNTEAGYLIQTKFENVKLETGTLSRLLSDEESVAYVMESYVLNWAAGVSRLYWYDWDSNRMGLGDNLGKQAKPAAMGYETIRNWLLGAVVTGCDKDARENWSCSLIRGGRREWIVWNADQPGSFDVPAKWKVTQATTLSGAGVLSNVALGKSGSLKVDAIPVLLQ
jgi:hypothetical protein